MRSAPEARDSVQVIWLVLYFFSQSNMCLILKRLAHILSYLLMFV